MHHLLIFSAFLAGNSEPEPDPTADAIGLRFSWPVGLECTVQLTEARAGLGPRWDGAGVGSHSFVVQSWPDGLLLHRTGATWEYTSGGPQDDVGRLLDRASWVLPDRILSFDGHFRRIEHLEAYVTGLHAELAAALRPLSPEAREAVESRLAAEYATRPLQSKLAWQWEQTIGMWNGVLLPELATGTGFADGADELLPEGEVPWVYSFNIVQRMPCAEETGEPLCVRIEYTAAPGARTTSLLQANQALLLGPEGANAADVVWSESKVTRRGEMILTTSTLVPLTRTETHHVVTEARWGGDKVQFLDLTATVSERWGCSRGAALPATTGGDGR